MYKSAYWQTYPKLLTLCKRSVVAVWARWHLVACVKSKVKAAVCTTITALARFFTGVNFCYSCHIAPPMFVTKLSIVILLKVIHNNITTKIFSIFPQCCAYIVKKLSKIWTNFYFMV